MVMAGAGQDEAGRSAGQRASTSRSVDASAYPTPGDDYGSPAIAASITTPFSRHIGRNRACASCRERKLKCDGARPICGQCSRAWSIRKRSLRNKGLSEEHTRGLEKPCEYIDVRSRRDRGGGQGSGAGPSRRSQNDTSTLEGAQKECRRLERELRLAKERLQNAGEEIPSSDTAAQFRPDELSIAQVLATTMRSAGAEGGTASHFSAGDRDELQSAFSDPSAFTSFVEGLAQRAVAQGDGVGDDGNDDAINAKADEIMEPVQAQNTDESLLFDVSTSAAGHPGSSVGQPDPLMELVLSGWPADFPAPSMVDTLVRIFFDEVGHARLLFHPSRFFQRLAQGPTSSRFPHSAILHSIFAIAFVVRPDLDPASSHAASASAQQPAATEDVLDTQIKQRHSRSRSFADPAYQAGHKQGITMALQSRYDRERAKLGSAGYHSERAQYHLTIGMWEGGDLMSLAKAAFLLTMKRYGCGELFDAWLSASISTRLCVALAINHSHPTGPTVSAAQPAKTKTPVDTVRLAMTGAPGDWLEEEERRRLMFLVLLTDRSACAATLWANSLDDADITVELPLLSNADFLAGDRAPAADAPRQTLQSPDLFTKNHLDGFNTMIKAAVLMGRIAAFLSRLPSFATEDTMRSNGVFDRLDNTLTSFTLSLPFRATDLDEHGEIDVFRFVTYAVLHTDTLMLHEPLLKLNAHSAAMCEAACRSVLDLLRILIAAGISFARLPPVLILCLSTAGRVLVKRLQVVRADAEIDRDASRGSGTPQTAASVIEQFDFDIQQPAPFTWSFTPVNKTHEPPCAGLGGPATSEKEEKLRGEIDLVFKYLCKVGQTWPLATRQAQALAQMLGIDVAVPEALEQGIFTERNSNVRHGSS